MSATAQKRVRSEINSQDENFIFSLTSNPEIIQMNKKVFSCGAGALPKELPSALLIDLEVDKLRERIVELISAAGEIKICSKTIKEYFFIPTRKVSAWWFSQLAEKNTIKSPSFFQIAQLEAVAHVLDEWQIQRCFVFVDDAKFSKTAGIICRQRGVLPVLLQSNRKKDVSGPRRIKEYLRNSSRLSIIFIRALITFVCRIYRGAQAKIMLGSAPKNRQRQNNELLIATYFPSADPANVKIGQLENKFLGPLENLLKHLTKKIIWLWLFVYVDNRTYGDAIRLAKELRRRGENGFLLEQFFTVAAICRIIAQWFKMIFRYLKVRNELTAEIAQLFSRNNYSEIIRKMNDYSFIGWQGLESIIYLELFCEAIARLPLSKRCLHFSEMHTWEISLNAAKQIYAPDMKTIGYVHSSVSPNYFFYLQDPANLMKSELNYPAVDIIAANGSIAGNQFRRTGYERVEEVEATRYLYLSEKLLQSSESKNKNLIVVATSACSIETEEIIALVTSALFGLEALTVLFKGHPILPLNYFFKKLKISPVRDKFCITETPISELLCRAKILIVGDSSVALEALAVGCRVIIPVLSSWMFMSPLKGQEEFYDKIYNVEQLKNKVIELASKSEPPEEEKKKALIKLYWHLDPSLPRWEKLMRLEHGF